ncbi:MAG TPA: inositol monophosphatase family protein [Gemmatimonadaceae bacterium]|nr:inositol monophosphatase family protein [Gemmatimonadaceae bacterium]
MTGIARTENATAADNYMNAVAEVATLAGDVARRYYGKGPKVRLKQDGSPVSAADYDAERSAREWIEKNFPSDGIIGEELPPTRESAKRRWVIDPIDGTFTFLQTVPLWGTLVAVMEGESVIAGAAYFPALAETVVAAPGKGAWWNGSRTVVSEVSDLSSARLVTTDARFKRDPTRRDRWLRLQDGAQAMRTWGDCYGYLLVATGRADVMVDDVMSVWDAAALLPVITEAGGAFTDWKGRTTAFGGDAIATNSRLAGAVRAILVAPTAGDSSSAGA